MWALDRLLVMWWAGRESNPHSRRRLIYSQRSSPPAQPTHVRRGDGPRLRSRGGPGTDGRRWSRRRDSNPEPAVYKTAALPIELRRHDGQGHTADDPIPAPGDDRPGRPDGSSVGGAASRRRRTLGGALGRRGVGRATREQVVGIGRVGIGGWRGRGLWGGGRCARAFWV